MVNTLFRPIKRPNGREDITPCPVCECGNVRGPLGGVCGNCCGAIPSIEELKKANKESKNAYSR